VLVNTLRFRFERLPDGMIEALETITDLDTLDGLHAPAIRAGSIEEFQQSLPRLLNCDDQRGTKTFRAPPRRG
jgi:hypothetical protein